MNVVRLDERRRSRTPSITPQSIAASWLLLGAVMFVSGCVATIAASEASAAALNAWRK